MAKYDKICGSDLGDLGNNARNCPQYFWNIENMPLVNVQCSYWVNFLEGLYFNRNIARNWVSGLLRPKASQS